MDYANEEKKSLKIFRQAITEKIKANPQKSSAQAITGKIKANPQKSSIQSITENTKENTKIISYWKCSKRRRCKQK